MGTLNIKSDPWSLLWCVLSTTWAILFMSEHAMGVDGCRFLDPEKNHSNCFTDQWCLIIVTRFMFLIEFKSIFKLVTTNFFMIICLEKYNWVLDGSWPRMSFVEANNSCNSEHSSLHLQQQVILYFSLLFWVYMGFWYYQID